MGPKSMHSYQVWFQPVVSASLGNLEMQSPGPRPRPTESETLQGRLAVMFRQALQFETFALTSG